MEKIQVVLPYNEDTKEILKDVWKLEEKEKGKFNLLRIASISKSIDELSELVEMVCFKEEDLSPTEKEKYKNSLITLVINEDETLSYQ